MTLSQRMQTVLASLRNTLSLCRSALAEKGVVVDEDPTPKELPELILRILQGSGGTSQEPRQCWWIIDFSKYDSVGTPCIVHTVDNDYHQPFNNPSNAWLSAIPSIIGVSNNSLIMIDESRLLSDPVRPATKNQSNFIPNIRLEDNYNPGSETSHDDHNLEFQMIYVDMDIGIQIAPSLPHSGSTLPEDISLLLTPGYSTGYQLPTTSLGQAEFSGWQIEPTVQQSVSVTPNMRLTPTFAFTAEIITVSNQYMGNFGELAAQQIADDTIYETLDNPNIRVAPSFQPSMQLLTVDSVIMDDGSIGPTTDQENPFNPDLNIDPDYNPE